MTASKVKPPKSSPAPREAEILDALPLLVALVGPDDELMPVNKAGQEFWGGRLKKLSPHFAALAERVRAGGELITMHDMTLERYLEEYRGTVHCQPHGADHLLLTIDLKGMPHAPGASAWKQEITRAAGVMAAMMAHEVKNPLSSIRGAAQLLRDTVGEAERPLADLICNETLRIRDLLDQVEVFSDERQVELVPLNIHEVLQYSMRVAKAGFAAHVKFVERYDPSLPPVASHRDALVQMFLNIIKNASEALGEVEGPVITLTTFYQSGLKMTEKKLPITVNISDNGRGIPEEIRKKLFEPLVSSKAQGRGLGLAVVAKIASDLGVIVECDDPPTHQGASFTIHLPRSNV
ncbi:MAG: ATP-binding protein [Alphaproteobacteria bacterium]|nr:ATP-binding protein [Alphaproteobacteria bacterium]